ncbi:protein of unknown function [Aminobacter niigataensis]|nr:protein of unknown function [Aminobacter niigataensis]CAI2935678.1 protein of unknown function [Aminobacter niigataensis]CAI2935680.1 protein of unknown function [Aminobacter niigataensis]
MRLFSGWSPNSHRAFNEGIKPGDRNPGAWRISGSRRRHSRTVLAMVNGGLFADFANPNLRKTRNLEVSQFKSIAYESRERLLRRTVTQAGPVR